jgi:hypothetical protein
LLPPERRVVADQFRPDVRAAMGQVIQRCREVAGVPEDDGGHQPASAEPPGTERLLDPPPRSASAACSTTDRICREVRVTHLAASGVIS